ncbi:lactate dehydrogenase [Corynebacterium imitans]|uniref:L-lactate dehydrogenase n=1 Tax=Corynebacterium imitans TaxID=156978 RepID=A0A076NNA0_9CORY|nr:lactate dehydrogenase [Corynebacterium imitans]
MTNPSTPHKNITPGNKVVLIGAGSVGMAYAYALINQGLCDQLAIIDINEEKTWGEVEDLNHSVPYSGHNTKVTVGTYEDCRDAALIVNCAGVAQREGETRLDLVGRNVKIFDSINKEVMANGFNGIYLVATNPVDVLTYATQKQTGLPASQVLGSGTVLDTARWRYNLSQKYNVSATSVHSYIIGEHGDTELPVISTGSIAGIALRNRLAKEAETNPDVYKEIDEMFVATRDAAYKIIQAKGSTDFGIGGCLARITRAIFMNEDVVLPVSAKLDGQYGQSDIYIGTPAVVNRNGIREAIELYLNDEELEKFTHSAETLRNVMKEAELV